MGNFADTGGKVILRAKILGHELEILAQTRTRISLLEERNRGLRVTAAEERGARRIAYG